MLGKRLNHQSVDQKHIYILYINTVRQNPDFGGSFFARLFRTETPAGLNPVPKSPYPLIGALAKESSISKIPMLDCGGTVDHGKTWKQTPCHCHVQYGTTVYNGTI